MNPEPQNTPLTPPNGTPPPAAAPATFGPQQPQMTPQPEVNLGTASTQQVAQTPVTSSEPAAFDPFATQTQTTPPPAYAAEPTVQAPVVTAPDPAPSATSAPAPDQSVIAPGVPFGDPAQPVAANPIGAVTPVAPGAAPETAKVALIMGSIGLLAWLLPIIGLPVTIIALVFAIKGVKRSQKHAKLALGFAIFGLVATLINAAAGGYIAYQAMQKAANDEAQSSSKTETLNTVPYPEESRTAFVQSCAANGGTEAKCTCTLNEIEKQLTFEEFSAVDKEISETGKVPDGFREVQDNAIAACTE